MNRIDWLIEFEQCLRDSALALRCAWKLAKHNGMEQTEKELASTILDIETARQQVKDHIGL